VVQQTEEVHSRSGPAVGVAEEVGRSGGVSAGWEWSINARRGRNERNIFRKIKKNHHEMLSPASVDKPVHKIPLRPQNCAFFDHDDVFAY
jgi:hypothetical protein